MHWALDHWFEIVIALAWLALQINQWTLSRQLKQLQQDVEVLIVASIPEVGFPAHIEACWEDVGAHGRFLTDLGGMSIKMRDQMFDEFVKALGKPILGAPAAGSVHDVMSDLDRWLTKQAK